MKAGQKFICPVFIYKLKPGASCTMPRKSNCRKCCFKQRMSFMGTVKPACLPYFPPENRFHLLLKEATFLLSKSKGLIIQSGISFLFDSRII